MRRRSESGMVALPEGVRCVRRGRRTYYYYAPGRGTKAAHAPVRLPGAQPTRNSGASCAPPAARASRTKPNSRR